MDERPVAALHVGDDRSKLRTRCGAINKKTWGKKMSELDIFGFIGMNRSVFATFFLCGVLMPLALVVIA